ncbi:MAG: hypothetical protein ACM3OG_00590 [Actinomycetota bacterium]
MVSYRGRATAGLLVLLTALLWQRPLAASPVPVRFAEGSLHGFLALSTPKEVLIASGDLLQAGRDEEVSSRLLFHFNDGSLFDETAVFTQRNIFTLQSYRLVQRGPAFPEDTEISLERASGKYHVITRSRKDGREKVLDGTLALPPDVYNGMVLTILKNLSSGNGETVHLVAFTPAPKLIKLKLSPSGERKVLIGRSERTATHYVLKPILGFWLKLIATLLGRTPPENHAWIVTADVPAFVRFEGPLYMNGPVWRIELASPRWPGRKPPAERFPKAPGTRAGAP